MSGISFSKKQIIINLFKIVITVLILLLIAYFALGWSIKDIITHKRYLDPQSIAMAILLAVAMLLVIIEMAFLNKIGDFLDKSVYALKNALKGNWGEKKTFEKLREILDERYKIYTNFQIPGKKFDNDAIVLGPKGIISIEVKNISGEFDFIGEEIYKHKWCNGDECLCRLNMYHSPTREIIRHSLFLEEWLTQSGYKDITIKKAVLMVGSRFKINKIESPAVYVIVGLDNLANYIQESYDDPQFTPEFCQKLSKLFG